MGSCLSSSNDTSQHIAIDVVSTPAAASSPNGAPTKHDRFPPAAETSDVRAPEEPARSPATAAVAETTAEVKSLGPDSKPLVMGAVAAAQPAAQATPSGAQQQPRDVLAGRPKPFFGPADSRLSVYSDAADIEPAADHAMPELPPSAQIPSATVTPAGNVLMHLNRAAILQNRAGFGATLPPIPSSKSSYTDLPDTAGSSTPHAGRGGPASNRIVAAASQQPAGDGFPASGGLGDSGFGDSGVFDGPGGITGFGGTPTAGGPAGGAVTSQTSASSSAAANAAAGDSTGGQSLTLSTLTSAPSSGLPPFALGAPSNGPGGGVFMTSLQGLGVEATLGEMQQMALIGNGGGGCVYIGRWRGVTVAVKFIVSSNDDQLTRSQREALMSRLASHPHVVQTYATSVTQLTEHMFKLKEGCAQQGPMAAADPNISHDLLAGLTSGSWIRGELQAALGDGGSRISGSGAPGALPGCGGPTAGAPLPTILEAARSSAGSMSVSTSIRGVGPHDSLPPGSVSVVQTGTYESDGQLSSSSVSRAKGQQDTAGILSSPALVGQNDVSVGVTCSAVPSSQTSNTSSVAGGHGRLLQAALAGGGPPVSGGLQPGSSPVSCESAMAGEAMADGTQAANSNGGSSRLKTSGAGDPRPGGAGVAAGTQAGAATSAAGFATEDDAAAAAAAGGRGQQSAGVADSFDASFVRDHLGRANYSIHEVLRQLGAHEGQFLTMVVMEYCDGGSLLAALKEGPFHRDTTSWSPRMLLRSTVRTALEIAHGMQHLHLSGLVHGDLKPANVLLKGSNHDKRKFVAKVSDLGLAHPVGSADEMAIDDGRIGSIAYMAPEVFRGRIMKASDVYSFGVLLWQLASGTGAAPFEGAHPIAIALGVSEGKMTLRWPPGVFRPLQQLGELCTQQDAAARPSFKSVVGALEKLERHMQRLATAAAAGSSGSPGPPNVSIISPASSLTHPPVSSAVAVSGTGMGTSPFVSANVNPQR